MGRFSDRRLGWVAAAVAVLVAAVVIGVVRPGGTTVHAATPGDDTITVTGVGTADATPDTLSVDFTVHVTRGTVQEALDAQAGAVRRLLDALKSSGVPRERTQTTDLSLDRHYDEHGVVTGYDANETVRAKVRPLSHAGRTISRAATSAGNAVAVGGLAFNLADDTEVVRSARHNAFAAPQGRTAPGSPHPCPAAASAGWRRSPRSSTRRSNRSTSTSATHCLAGRRLPAR